MSKQESEEVFESNEDLSNTTPDNSSPDTLRILEALLFASDELLTVSRLKAILPDNPDARQIRKMVDKINVQLQKERHPFEIVEIGGGYQFRTVSFYYTWVRQIFKEKASKKLSVQALECLAIIAYKQPLSKAEIEAIRGVVSDGAMKTLLEKNLVVINGRSEKPGRPLLYATSQEFLKYFGLNKLSDLPRIEEFEAIAREKMEELSIEELSHGDNPEAELDEALLETAVGKKDVDKLEPGIQETSGRGQSESEDVRAPEPTAVFEIAIDDADSTEKESISYDDVNKNSISQEPIIDDQENDMEEKSTGQGGLTDANGDNEETFDLEISFDDEGTEPLQKDQVVTDDTVAEAKKGNKDIAHSDNEQSDDDEVFLEFLPEDEKPQQDNGKTGKK